jgi:NAD-dependent SIR2 family protein deacetylase
MKHGAFVFTSNVDGHFQRAGFEPEQVMEVHGSIHWMQCGGECGIGRFAADGCQLEIDEATMRAREPLPACPACGALARPNVLMFGDWEWDGSHTSAQETRLQAWLQSVSGKRLVIVECGAGTAVPTVRHFSEQLVLAMDATLIRINLREPFVPAGQIGLALGALEALQALEERLARFL